MKTYLNYIKEQYEPNKELEYLFVQLSHINDLVIKFDLFDGVDLIIYYLYNGECLFYSYGRTKYIYINYEKIWNKITKNMIIEIGYEFKVEQFMTYCINKYFKVKDYHTDWRSGHDMADIDRKFKYNKS